MDAIDLCGDEQKEIDGAVWVLDDDDDVDPAHRQAAGKEEHQEKQQGSHHNNRGMYLLDCGCQEVAEALLSRLQQQAVHLQQMLDGSAPAVADAVGCLACRHCSSLLSAQDAWKLLGCAVTSQVYTAVAKGVKQLVTEQQELDADPSGSAAAAAVCACVELWQDLASLEGLMLGGEPPVGSAAAQGRGGARRSKQQPAKANKAKGYNSKGTKAWAAGTGYGGSEGFSKQAHAAMTAAAERQSAVDKAMTEHLNSITAILQDPLGTTCDPAAAAGPSSSNGSRKRSRSNASLLTGLPWPVCGVVLAGPLAWLLRLLFSNDSLMDVVGRTELYSAGMQLLR